MTGVDGPPERETILARRALRGTVNAVQLEIVGESRAVAYAACGGLWIMLLHRPPVVEDMLAAAPTLRRMSAVAPAGFGTLTWVLPGAGFLMDGPTRAAAAEVTEAWDQALRAQATLIEGQGFQAASVRMIITGLDLLTRPSSPTKVFSRLEDAIPWALPFSAERDVATAPLVAALRDFRSSVEQRSRDQLAAPRG